MDFAWWKEHIAEVRRTFAGQLHSTCGAATTYGIKPVMVNGKTFNPHLNSGAGAIILASLAGAKRIILLGYDCQHTGGKAHWHGDHPAKLGNANRPESWIKGFERAAREVSGIEVINCSRATALDMFPRKELGECLEVAE